MRGYGLPRRRCLINPDTADISFYGLKSSISRIPKYGSIKNSIRNVKAKRAARRKWKKRARAAQSREIRQVIAEEFAA